MFTLEMLAAAHGDCLWIEYGSGKEVRRILIDGGPAHTYPALRERILQLGADDRRFELLMVTHIDADHIEGVVRLLQDAPALGCHFERIWFNGREQLNQIHDPAGAPLGAVQGEMLGLLIADYEAQADRKVWNLDLPERLAAIDRNGGKLPGVDLPGDCRLTLLSPDLDRLLELKTRWREELRKAKVSSGDTNTLRRLLESSTTLRPLGDVLGDSGPTMEDRYEVPDPEGRDLAAGHADTLGRGHGEPGADAKFGSDTSLANGSSIAVLLEYPKDNPQVRLLLAGDAWPSVLETSIDVLLGEPGKRLALTGLKLPHHGSVANLSASLLGKLRCKNYLVSTSGAVFRHPHARAIGLLLSEHAGQGKPQLHFNYLTETTQPWYQEADQKASGYVAFFPKGLSLVL
jgi:hypothetical protein